ncbi:hypothetical protein GCM10020366_67070 [Saccharopolyspora gregorii]|uniref:Uncharacterized protein n=1 Tax=Saccharopolyspora gregorii TaxID=33914 RepID=A0ABP6S1Y6_9PSEU
MASWPPTTMGVGSWAAEAGVASASAAPAASTPVSRERVRMGDESFRVPGPGTARGGARSGAAGRVTTDGKDLHSSEAPT